MKLKIKHDKKSNTISVNGVVLADSFLRLGIGAPIFPDKVLHAVSKGGGIVTAYPVDLCKNCQRRNFP